MSGSALHAGARTLSPGDTVTFVYSPDKRPRRATELVVQKDPGDEKIFAGASLLSGINGENRRNLTPALAVDSNQSGGSQLGTDANPVPILGAGGGIDVEREIAVDEEARLTLTSPSANASDVDCLFGFVVEEVVDA